MKNIIRTSVLLLIFVSLNCHLGPRIKLDPASKDFYETARLIMTKEEKEIFNHLPHKKSRQEFIQDFWAKRDPDPDTEENEFKDEFFRRIEYANSHFKEGIPGWKTDRGRIYIYLGAPDKVEERPFLNLGEARGLIWWAYYKYQLAIEFIDTTGNGTYNINRHYGGIGNLMWVIEKAKFGQIFTQGEAKFVDFDLFFSSQKKEIAIVIPVANLSFKSQDGFLQADFDFEFFIYNKDGHKENMFTRTKSFKEQEEKVVKMEKLNFTFPYDLKPGRYYFDVIITIKPNIGKVRKIFKVKV